MDINALKKMMTEEEMSFRGALSEYLGFKLGGALNFLNSRGLWFMTWHIDSRPGDAVIPLKGQGGVFPMAYKAKIKQSIIYQINAGTAARLSVNARVHTQATPSGVNLFASPGFTLYSTGSNSFVWKDYDDGTNMIQFPTGSRGTDWREPLFASDADRTIAQNSLLSLDIGTLQTAGSEAGLVLVFEPIN